MEIRGKEIIEDFCRKHADATTPLEHWVEYIEMAKWTNHNELKASFPSVDYVGEKRYVFNIKGNNYRLIAAVVFVLGRLTVRYVGTHAEYNKIKDIKTI
ncbi:MAG: type II toxin-antitoxin system HigB family toxin [Bacteroidales bacterium]|nr:type II toxin-antitoxin system HigB family toxin [Bacteroidales bacterium]